MTEFAITSHFVDAQDSSPDGMWSETDLWETIESVNAYIAKWRERGEVTLVTWTGPYSVEINIRIP